MPAVRQRGAFGVARIATLYALIALCATVVNIACQAVVLWAWTGPHAVKLSVLVATLSDVPFKYVLEKRLVFAFRTRDLSHDARLFVLYGLFGAGTTVLFWGVEYAFHLAFGTEGMRYVGAAIGLGLGFLVRYQVDKRFVFVAPARPASGDDFRESVA